MPEERQMARSRPRGGARGDWRLPTTLLPRLQAGIPQERVNEKSTTMKRMIEGMPNAT